MKKIKFVIYTSSYKIVHSFCAVDFLGAFRYYLNYLCSKCLTKEEFSKCNLFLHLGFIDVDGFIKNIVPANLALNLFEFCSYNAVAFDIPFHIV